MKTLEIYKYIKIDDYSATPKYLQLASSIISAIREDKIKKNDILPSINDLSFELEISRDTAEKSYRYLKNMGILGSVPGKGYYIKSIEVGAPLKVFLLFNKLSEHKKIIYDAFASKLGDLATIDFYIYNNDFSLFKKLLAEKLDEYAYYIIIPHFLEGGEDAYKIINTIPKDKLVLLDKKIVGVDAEYGAVY